mmetsp:Transcript_42964/g.100679  ORF Transcript_42964/g.100679 Transcript_42964/m.100679 type:complete len:306 (-) Transcript_42964:347-1264(-)
MSRWWHAEANVAFCLTAKVGISEQLDYLNWHSVGLPGACQYGPIHVLSARAICAAAFNTTPWGSYSRYGSKSRGALLNAAHTSPEVRVRCASAPLVVPFRDPWARLCSAFSDKMYHDGCDGDDSCFRRRWIPWFSLDRQRNLFVRFLMALLQSGTAQKVNGTSLNGHFNLQTSWCLNSRTISTHPTVHGAQLEVAGSLDVFSRLLGRTTPFSATVQGAYVPQSSTPCFLVPENVLRRLASWLAPDYHYIRRRFNVTYASFTTISRLSSSARQHLRVCPHNKTITTPERHLDDDDMGIDGGAGEEV